MEGAFVRTDTGEYLVQRFASNPWGFVLADDDQVWPGGFGCGSETWEIVPAAEVPQADRERLGWLLEERG